ncbi:MAG: universal stress protein [Brevirhabdus sp.]
MKSILLPIDLFHDTGWQGALAHALLLSKTSGATLHLLTVIPDYGMSMVGAFFPKDFSESAVSTTKKQLSDFVKENIPDGVSVQEHVRHGTVYKEILGLSEKLDVDMIVMASHRPEMQDYLLGPNAARVVRHAKTSVTVMR